MVYFENAFRWSCFHHKKVPFLLSSCSCFLASMRWCNLKGHDNEIVHSFLTSVWPSHTCDSADGRAVWHNSTGMRPVRRSRLATILRADDVYWRFSAFGTQFAATAGTDTRFLVWCGQSPQRDAQKMTQQPSFVVLRGLSLGFLCPSDVKFLVLEVLRNSFVDHWSRHIWKMSV
jgi:hypothetical protein